MCQSLSDAPEQTVVQNQALSVALDNVEKNDQIQLEKLQQEIQALQVKIEFLLLERSKIRTNLDQMFKLWKKLQPQMVLIDRLLNSHVWKKLEQQMKQNFKY
jgi:predicted RNase H-like nuclease (RuvC/YqgF family)